MLIRRVASDSPRGIYLYLPSHVRTTRAELVGMGVRTWQWADEGDRTRDVDARLCGQCRQRKRRLSSSAPGIVINLYV